MRRKWSIKLVRFNLSIESSHQFNQMHLIFYTYFVSKKGNVVKVNLGDNRKIVGEIMQIRFDEDKKYLLHYHCEESGVRINEWIRGADIANCGPFDDEDFLIWMTG